MALSNQHMEPMKRNARIDLQLLHPAERTIAGDPGEMDQNRPQ